MSDQTSSMATAAHQHGEGSQGTDESPVEYDDVVEFDPNELEERATYHTAMQDAIVGINQGGGGAADGFANIGVLSGGMVLGRMSMSSAASTRDELELVAVTQHEAKQRGGAKLFGGKPRKPKLIRPLSVLKETDKKLAALGNAGQGDFVSLMARKIVEYNINVPTITVEYRNLSVQTDALVGSAALPSVGNEFIGLIKTLLCLRGHLKKHTILDNLRGVLVPGRPTLLLGPPSSGKSMFLKVLSGQLKSSKKLQIQGDLKYNGHEQSEFVIERTAGYISQHDVHVPALTVMETLEYAYVCQNGMTGAEFDVPAEVLKAHQARVASGDVPSSPPGEGVFDLSALLKEVVGSGSKTLSIMRLFGIAHTANTPVGDSMLRGVSGGERKRVTTAEMLVGPKRMLLADEISTGLDSATLHSIISLLAKVTRGFRLTTLTSLLQPPPEVFDLFDDLILMADGQIVYHGPISDVVPFFNSLGFFVPTRKDIPSFLQEVTTPMGQVEYASPELRRAKGIPEDVDVHATGQCFDFLVPIPDMVEAFWKSSNGLAMQALLDNPFDRSTSHPAALVRTKYALSFWESLWVVFRRQIMLILRDPILVKGRVMQCIVIGLIIGSLFYLLPTTPNNARSFFGAMFLHVMFVAMGQMPTLSVTIATKSVWYKQRDAFFYGAFTHSLACMLASIPTLLLDTAVYAVIVYFMNGLYASAGAFFTFYLVLFVFALNMSAIFRIIAWVAPNGVAANAYGGLVLLVLIVLSGFAIIRTAIPGWWIWGYYLSPFAWALRAIVINEMTTPAWSEPYPGTTETVGEFSLQFFGFFTDRAWLWGGVGYLIGCAFIFMGIGTFALQYLSGEPVVARVVDHEALAEERQRRAAEKKDPQVVVVQDIDNGEVVSKDKDRSSTLTRRGSLPPREPATAAQVLGPAGSGPIAVSSSIPFTQVTLVFQDLRYYVPNPSFKGKASLTTAMPTPPPAKAAAEASKPVVVEMAGADGAPAGPRPVAEAAEAAPPPAAEEIPPQLELLKGITGFAEPRVLIALMGGSGAGKTTLMDCIAGRKTVGHITGSITVNGFPKDQATWARVIGYVEQMDIHTPALTVIESLRFSARLRLASTVTDHQAWDYVDEVVSIVDMQDNIFDYVGIPGVTGLSVEQRKRLTIGVELVANPSVIFMDEPTSGLDARAAAIVMRAVRNVARNNRTVMVTIHQPSIEIFEAFDYLLLLQRGGRTTYFGPLGPESKHLVDYLQAVPGCAPIPHGANPATWMLEVTGGAMAVAAKAVKADWPALYAGSELAAKNEQYGQDLVTRLQSSHTALSNTSKYASTYLKQYVMLMYKFRLAYWRTPSYNWVRMSTTVLNALFYGSCYYEAGIMPNPASTSNVQSVMGVIFSSTTFLGMSSMMAIMPFLGLERVVYYREQAGKMYSPWAYGIISAVVEVPYMLVQSAIFTCISYFMIKYIKTAENFFFYYLFVFLSLMFFTTFGSALVYITPSQQLGQVVASGLTFLFNIMNGFVITFPLMPKYWQWLNRGSPTTWMLYALGSDQLGGSTIPFSDTEGGPITTTVGGFMQSYFGYKYSFRFVCIPIVLAYIVFLRVVAIFALRWISFLKR